MWSYNCVSTGNEWGSVSRSALTFWGRVTHRCVSKQSIIASDNGLSPWYQCSSGIQMERDHLRFRKWAVNIVTYSQCYHFRIQDTAFSLQWRHNGRHSVSNHQSHHCLLNCLFRRRSKKTSKLRITGLCAVNSPGTGEFPAQMASYAENISIWWRYHVPTEPHCA